MNELQHHGVKGQKWGVRRYQNKDGSLTPAGERKYAQKPTAPESRSTRRGQARVRDLEKNLSMVNRTKNVDTEMKDYVTKALNKAIGKEKLGVIKSRYRDEYNQGKSLAQRAISRIIGTPNTYANVMSELDKK